MVAAADALQTAAAGCAGTWQRNLAECAPLARWLKQGPALLDLLLQGLLLLKSLLLQKCMWQSALARMCPNYHQ